MKPGNYVVSREATRHVELSWERCKSQYALSRTGWRVPTFIRAADLDDRRDTASFVFPIACAELATVSRTLRGPIGVVVTDHDAIILAYSGTQCFAEAAHKFGLRPGAIWHESHQGTNGMGTCLAECNPVVVERQQHYLQQNAVLSCYAVPILDGRGRLAGVVNASTLGSAEPSSMMALLDLVARNIEHRSLLSRGNDHFVLRLHPQREYLSTSAEAIFIVTRVGIVERINRAALEMLSAPTYSAICGRSIGDVMGLELSELQRIATATPTEPRFLQSAPYFALAQPPLVDEKTAGQTPTPDNMEDALEKAERGALLSALDRSCGNVTDAAKRLGISRRTLHRKLRRYAICREH